jgi:hypothetical protein
MKPRAAFRDTCPGPLALCGRFARERHTAPFVLTPQMDGVSIKLREPRVGRSQPALLPCSKAREIAGYAAGEEHVAKSKRSTPAHAPCRWRRSKLAREM